MVADGFTRSSAAERKGIIVSIPAPGSSDAATVTNLHDEIDAH
jgi:hypothetical protein